MRLQYKGGFKGSCAVVLSSSNGLLVFLRRRSVCESLRSNEAAEFWTIFLCPSDRIQNFGRFGRLELKPIFVLQPRQSWKSHSLQSMISVLTLFLSLAWQRSKHLGESSASVLLLQKPKFYIVFSDPDTTEGIKQVDSDDYYDTLVADNQRKLLATSAPSTIANRESRKKLNSKQRKLIISSSQIFMETNWNCKAFLIWENDLVRGLTRDEPPSTGPVLGPVVFEDPQKATKKAFMTTQSTKFFGLVENSEQLK